MINTIAEAFCKEVPALRYTLHDTFGQCARAMMHCRVMRLSVMERLRGKIIYGCARCLTLLPPQAGSSSSSWEELRRSLYTERL